MARGQNKAKKKSCPDVYKSKKIILPLLITLADLSATQRTFMLSHLNEKTLRTLCCVVDKVLHGKFPKLVKENLSQRLKSNKKSLRQLCRANRLTEGTIRNNLTKMGGGAFRLILNTAVPLYA